LGTLAANFQQHSRSAHPATFRLSALHPDAQPFHPQSVEKKRAKIPSLYLPSLSSGPSGCGFLGSSYSPSREYMPQSTNPETSRKNGWKPLLKSMAYIFQRQSQEVLIRKPPESPDGSVLRRTKSKKLSHVFFERSMTYWAKTFFVKLSQEPALTSALASISWPFRHEFCISKMH